MNGTPRIGEEEWRRRFESARSMGRTMLQLAAEHEVPITTVRYWSKRVSKGGAAKDVGLTSRDVPDFVKVVPTSRKKPDNSEQSVIVELRDIRIHMTSPKDIAVVMALIDAIRGCQ